MKAVIELDIPEWQIGQDVSVYFPDTMVKHGKCELLKEQEAKPVMIDEHSVHCPSCGNELFTYPRQKYCDECGQAVNWDG